MSEQQRLNLQEELRRNIGKLEGGKSSLNIALIGPTGCGKSSLINTFAASIATDHWHQYAHGGAGVDTQTTVRLKSFIGSRYGADWDTEGYALPTLVDLTGFADEDTALIEEILRLIFYGKIKDESNINAIFRFGYMVIRLWAIR
ncbi:hypothetical protein KP79_PYT01529 [Mizuhopecten yessoensis]|uniref:Uncharacterized protein n=1 Tax=Mizuhopecten yessoensis TaxID=6573 RepID=A0A210QAF1_MIZYE|nr:hypothetical protein KP79_PYT01529 [Mizuhopecten yessoensis]